MKRAGLFLLVLAACVASATALAEQQASSTAVASPDIASQQIDALQFAVEGLSGAGGNLGRFSYIVDLLDENGLGEVASGENIDWYTLQKNVVIDLPGESSQLIYIVAHYDKTDMNPVTVVSLLLNGLLDPLAGLTFFSDGATDNASGVAVAVQLARELEARERYYSYRILLTGAEESGLRGARAHLARLSSEEKENILLAINIDTVGLADSKNCVSIPVSDDARVVDALEIAIAQGYTLRQGVIPSGASADYAPFRRQNFLYDFGRGLMFNLPGGLLPQRSWFTSSHSASVVNFTACEAIDAWDYIGGLLFLPFGKIHGPRDSLGKIDYDRLYQQYDLIRLLLERIEGENAALATVQK